MTLERRWGELGGERVEALCRVEESLIDEREHIRMLILD
jgi:hypothetical protein